MWCAGRKVHRFSRIRLLDHDPDGEGARIGACLELAVKVFVSMSICAIAASPLQTVRSILLAASQRRTMLVREFGESFAGGTCGLIASRLPWFPRRLMGNENILSTAPNQCTMIDH